MSALSPFAVPTTVGERMWAEEIVKVGWLNLISDPVNQLPEFGRNMINRINLLEDLHRVELASVNAGEAPRHAIVDPIADANIRHCRRHACE